MLATIENMRAHARKRGTELTAYSPATGERVSANPADYWDAPDGFVVSDWEGEPMILGWFITRFVPVTS